MVSRLRELDGTIVFVMINLGLILVSAIACAPFAESIESSATGMFRASLAYVAVLGWQPLVAFFFARRLFTEKPFDDGMRPTRFRDSFIAVCIAMFVLGVAVVIDAVANHPGAKSSPELLGSPSLLTIIKVLVAFALIVTMLWLQAIVEEVAWRGYVLPRLMRTFGAWPGLIIHGLLWGICYAPLFALAGGTVHRALAFVVTASLLGVVLGWLRLSSRSIYASAASNATLTICAGLPLVVVGERSLFSAAFGPFGWFPLAGLILAIAFHRRWRSAIVVPWRRVPEHIN